MSKEALEASIVAWERKRDELDPEEIHTGISACPLCTVYWISSLNSCDGCPVKNRTGLAICDNTPYEAAYQALATWSSLPKNKARQRKWRLAAQAEIDFLKSLREPNAQ